MLSKRNTHWIKVVPRLGSRSLLKDAIHNFSYHLGYVQGYVRLKRSHQTKRNSVGGFRELTRFDCFDNHFMFQTYWLELLRTFQNCGLTLMVFGASVVTCLLPLTFMVYQLSCTPFSLRSKCHTPFCENIEDNPCFISFAKACFWFSKI